MNTALQKALEYFGGSQTKLAHAIGARNLQTVNNWFVRGTVPTPEWCIEIEAATNGHVRCEEFHPNVKWHVLRQSCRKRQPGRDRQARTNNNS